MIGPQAAAAQHFQQKILSRQFYSFLFIHHFVCPIYCNLTSFVISTHVVKYKLFDANLPTTALELESRSSWDKKFFFAV
jgi:hypothetical protein